MRILHDTHLGVTRSAGVTPASALALRKHILQQFESLLPDDQDLMILGDLLDTPNIPISDVLETYRILVRWLNKQNKLILVKGNHDTAKTNTTVSSFDFLCSLLTDYSNKVLVIDKQGEMTPYGYVIPHVQNQDRFNEELLKVPECDFLFLHVNVDNYHAVNSDASLNISAEQINNCRAKRIVCAHEHVRRDFLKVTLPGSNFATSVSDWLSQQDKFFAEITDGNLELIKCADRAQEYTELDWRELSVTPHKFIRVVGTATAAESAAVVTAISKFRALSEAFVVSNAVKIESDEGLAVDFESALLKARTFDIKEVLYTLLNAEEIKTLESLK